ncbi:RimK family alpha-L-glutamate ligase [Parabacteroides sp.]|uniref:ATP-grasp domain-containing protein n=1 Tax=Parabacteroides sp. TaxID=1869337 RepID=UPI0026DEBB32|nr:hypothetical protein [Parabacteroides sp.]MDO5428782.1 hypothetical protein [Parabacteroides sp.]
MKIAICRNPKIWNHPDFIRLTDNIAQACERKKLYYEFVDPYSSDAISQLGKFDVVIWFIQNFLWADLMEARSVLNAIERIGKKVFPNQSTNWHFDDKIAEMYAFQSINAPIPDSFVFYSQETALEFFKGSKFPIVAKLRCGSGANNVRLIKNYTQAERYTKKMFGKGVNPSPSLLFKATSKAKSSHDWKITISRLKKLPQFLYTRRQSKLMPNEKGYVYLQEYIPDNSTDYRVKVIGNHCWAFQRKVRKNDFRASGSGDLIFDNKKIPLKIIETSFQVSKALDLQCIAFDYIHDKRTDEYKIVEMSYGFGYDEFEAHNGYWDNSLTFHQETFSFYDWIIESIL